MVDSNNPNFMSKKEKLGENRESLSINSTLCWFSISFSLFLKFSKDGLKLGSSFQQFVIMSYLKDKQVMNILICHWLLPTCVGVLRNKNLLVRQFYDNPSKL